MMKIIAAPDSFKGSISAENFCSIAESCAANCKKNITIKKMPVADGGEGTMKLLVDALGGTVAECVIKGPLGGELHAKIGFIENGRCAVIECAQAIGLPLVKNRENPAAASTYGVGQMISFATSRGAHKIILALGGSCTNDCGSGMLSAIGVRFTDICGNIIDPVGASLHRIETIEFTEAFNKFREIKFTVMADVDNPLLGSNGCAAVFSPQKGADEKTVKNLENGAARFANIANKILGTDHSSDRGAGAAGGLGFAAAAFLKATLRRGADVMLDLYGFNEEAAASDLIITGEGCFDSQSLMGKAVGQILQRSGKTPVAVFCGRCVRPDTSLYPSLTSITEISLGIDEEYAMKNAEEILASVLKDYFSRL